MLNPGLKKFLKRKAGSFLVLGPPGTGKTYQLMRLIEHLLVIEKIKPQRLIIFCFNRRWAKILREDTSAFTGNSILEIPITTFFAYCTEIIKRMQFMYPFGGAVCPEKEIRILNAPEQWFLLKNTIIGGLDRNKYPVTFRYISSENTKVASSFTQEVFDFILRAQENLLGPPDIADILRERSTPVLDEITGIYSCYREKLIGENLYNYGRLLEDTVEFLKKNSDARKIIQENYDYIIVDDLQEVNKAQYEIIKALSRDNCIFFGNDDQCIYSFRGSMVSIFNEVYKNFSPEIRNNSNILFLKKNHRSCYQINKTNDLFISKNTFRISKRSETGKRGTGSVTIKEFKHSIDEVNFIVDSINYLIRRYQVKPEDILVLVKGRGYKTRLLENIMLKSGIAFLQRNSRALLDNPQVIYILNFIRMLALLRPYCGGRGTEDCKTPPEEESITIDLLYEAIVFSDFIGINPSAIIGKISGMKNIWQKLKAVPLLEEALKDFLCSKDGSVFEVITELLNDRRIGIFKHLAENKNLGDIERSTSISLIGDFLHTVRDFVEKNPDANSISDYINFLEDAMANRFLEEIEDSTKEFIRPGFVNIMSYHQCRGLEFEAVFLPFINKNYLPSRLGNTQLYDMQTFNYFSEGKKIEDEILRKKHFEDERKLFYNGLTRAKNFLFISSNIKESSSIFFEEIKAIQGDTVEDKRDNNGGTKIKEAPERPLGFLPAGSKTAGIYSGKNWLLRKSMVARTFKNANKGNVKEKKYSRDLLQLLIDYPGDQWWRTRKVTENSNKPFLLHNPSYSYSSLNTFRECPFKYKIKYFFNIGEEDNLAILVGSLYHRILKNFFKNPEKDYSWQNLKKALTDSFSSGRFDFEFNYLRNEVFGKALQDFKRFHGYFVEGKELNVLSEKEFSFMIDDDLIRGRIDFINLIGDREVQLVDFKSGIKNISQGDIQNDIQLRLYRLAVDLCSDMDFIKGRDISLRYVFIGEEKNRNPSVLLPAGIYDHEDFRNYLKSIIQKLKSENFIADPENYYSCKFCGYRLLCPNKNA